MVLERYGLLVLVFLSLFYSLGGRAEQTGDTMTVDFSGRLMGRRACTVNDDKTIMVAFGNVGINKVGTSETIKSINYTLNCSNMNEMNTVEMTIKAIPVAGHNSSMASSVQGLWITFLKNGQEQALNNSFVVTDWHNPPLLEVRLEKDQSTELQANAFSATATLMAEYF